MILINLRLNAAKGNKETLDMNFALSLLSEAAEQGVIDRLQAFTDSKGQSIASQQVADPDYWGSVGIIALTGILVVFLILAILIFFFWLMGTIFKAVDNKKKSKAAEKAASAAPTPAAPVIEAAEDIADNGETDQNEEIMAVIAAAVAAYSEQDGKEYRILDVQRSGARTRSAWGVAGISDNTRPF